MANLHLFGTTFTTNAQNAILKPPSLPGTVSGTFQNNVARIVINSPIGTTHEVDVELHIRMQADGANDFRPAPGIHAQPANARFRIVTSGTPTALSFHLHLGAIEVTNTFPQNGVETVGSNVAVRVPGTDIVRPNGLPLRLQTIGGGAILDLSANPALTLRAGTLRASTAALVDEFDPINFITIQVPLLESQHLSRELAFPLGTGSNATQVTLDHTGARLLYLHADLRNRTAPVAAANELFSPIGINGHALEVELGRNASGAFLKQIAVAPANGSALTLHAFGYAGRRNQHATFAVAGAVPLHARVGSRDRPATLMIAPAFDDNAGLPIENQVGGVLHGMIAAHEFRPAAQGTLFCRPADALPGNAGNFAIASAIVREHTTPWLRLAADGSSSMRHAKAGRAFVETQNSRISHLDFSGDEVVLPLLPKECFQGATAIRTQHYAEVGANYATHSHELQKATHETRLTEEPVAGASEVKIAELFSPKLVVGLADDNDRHEADIRLQKHQVIRDYGPVEITLQLDPANPPDYVVIRNNVFSGDFSLRLDAQSGARLGGKPTSPVRAIAKISRQFTLQEILARENITAADIGDLAIDRVDDAVRSAGWTGLLLFRTSLDFSEMGVLAGLLPADALQLEYVAITPEKTSGRISINARVHWTNPDPPTPPARPGAEQEATFRLNRLDAAWHDSELVYFHAEGEAKFSSFFGVDFNKPGDANPLPHLHIIGSYEPKTGAIRFLGKLAEPLPLLPADFGTVGPIRQAYIRGAEITSSQQQDGTRETAVSIDGTLDLGNIEFGGSEWFDLGDLPSIDFSGLQIVLPKPDLAPVWSRIRYPSLSIRTKSSSFRFGFFELKLQRIAMDWLPDGQGFDWGSLVNLHSADLANWARNFRFDLRLELMKLPELAAKSIDRLILDFTIGIGIRKGTFRFNLDDIHVGISAVGFDHLRLDLMRFLELSCDEVALENANGVKRLSFLNVVLRILDLTFVDGLSFVLFSTKDGEGFLGFLPFNDDKPSTEGALSVYWLLAGHNVSLRSTPMPGDGLARQLMSIDAPLVKDDNIAIRKAINEAISDESYLAFQSQLHGGGWLFAAGFDFFGLFQGKFLFQDRAYYGGVLRGGVFDEWFGSGFAISVLYTRGARPEQDTLYAALRVPMVVTGTFTFMGGVIALEIVMNGGFTLDVGFPWLQPNGSRLWHRALGAIVTPFQGSGGFYIRKYNQSSVVGNGDGILLAGGYAVQFGLGASFGGGTFRVWATIGVYAIAEGEFYFEKLRSGSTDLRGLRLAGAIGILGRAGGELNWWIISARVEIMISAETRLVLQWGRFLPLPDGSDPAGGPIQVTAEFLIYARASAEACIGSGWFRVCKGISVELPMRFAYSFRIGG